MREIRVVIIDDSLFVRKALVRVLSEVPGILVAGTGGTGEELLDNIASWNPDVVVLDLFMPGIGGLATLERLAGVHPARVIIMSTHSQKDAPLTIEALHRGAVDFIDKQQYSLVDFGSLRDVLTEKIMNVGGGQVRKVERKTAPAVAPAARKTECAPSSKFDIVLIGASTGGPPAIQQILTDMGPLPVPTVIVQHMPLGFTKPFAERLNAHMAMQVREAGHGDSLTAGSVFIAPSGMHLHVRREKNAFSSVLTKYPEKAQHRPSVDVMFESAVAFGGSVIAVLLTGMGQDGAQGMLHLSRSGAWTVAQDEATSVVWGMPRAAVELSAAKDVLPVGLIGGRVKELLGLR